jgi:hypothetical protein
VETTSSKPLDRLSRPTLRRLSRGADAPCHATARRGSAHLCFDPTAKNEPSLPGAVAGVLQSTTALPGGVCDGALLGAAVERVGHEVRLMPAEYVKAYIKRNKNDAADAEAICEAAQASKVRFNL